MTPRATYRIQFHKGFTFADAVLLAPYLKQLGISHLYASPIFAARAGSTHGYDIIDHTRINPELGGEEGFAALVSALRARGLGLIVDIVPNHMAVGGADNPWWLDVLENGQASPYSGMFDIDWDTPDVSMRGKLLVPFLDKPLDDALADGDIALIWDAGIGKLSFAYCEHRFPLRREDYARVTGGAEPGNASLDAWNTPAALQELLTLQHYQLAHWQIAPEAINWRRFFDVTGLAALRMEDEPVFQAVHAKLFQLYAAGFIDGVRVDHVDGLTDPKTYCCRLRTRLDGLDAQRPSDAPPGPAYIVVEKILAPSETLPADWGVDGTTGYDFMNDVSALLHDGRGEAPMTQLWTALSGRAADFESEERLARSELLHASFASHLRLTADAFHRLALFAAREVDEQRLQRALAALLEHFRAYRTYATGISRSPPPGPIFETAVLQAHAGISPDDAEALDFIAAAMRGDLAEFGQVAWRASRRFNQLAAPVAAKAVEDTAFFRYGRLLSRNDVGFVPGIFAFSKADFEMNAARRAADFPHALLATATHDHKRGEDVRARLAVLSEIADEWRHEVQVWFDLNAPLRSAAIDAGNEYQLYQTLVGTWPRDFGCDDVRLGEYAERVLGWREKSLREAKLKTSWTEQNQDFEKANMDFTRAILDPARSRPFLMRLGAFVTRIAPAGALNGLAQCILRCTSPGVPDLYQGTEFWDFSLVDPDNRRPVDYAARREALAQSQSPAAFLDYWYDGRVKQALTRSLLVLRTAEAECFAAGTYEPVAAKGPREDNVVAFLRRYRDKSIFVAVPRLCAAPCMSNGFPLPRPEFWEDTHIDIPGPERSWKSALDPGIVCQSRACFTCSELFANFPGAVLH